MMTLTAGPGTFQRPIVTTDEQGNIVRPLNEDGSPQMEQCPFDGFLVSDGKSNWICDDVKAIVSGNAIDIFAHGSKLTSCENNDTNRTLFAAYLTVDNTPITTDRALLLSQIDKGYEVIYQYLEDNRKLDLSLQQSVQQLQKFSAIKALLEVGDIMDAKLLISATEVDEVFTQERKDKYLAALQ